MNYVILPNDHLGYLSSTLPGERNALIRPSVSSPQNSLRRNKKLAQERPKLRATKCLEASPSPSIRDYEVIRGSLRMPCVEGILKTR